MTNRNPYMANGGLQQHILSMIFEEETGDVKPEVTAPTDEDIQEEEDNSAQVAAMKEEEEYNILANISMQERKRNPYLNQSLSGDGNWPVNKMGTNPYISPATNLNADTYLQAIFGNEGGKTGVDPSIRGSASGKYAIIKGGRKELYRKYYSGQMTYQQFEQQYNTNPQFEYDVAKKLANENISKSSSTAEAIGRWYSPAHAASGQWNVVPRPDYGNKITVGQYVNRALKNIR